jgi:carboxypeptidase C (cathepsin A)
MQNQHPFIRLYFCIAAQLLMVAAPGQSTKPAERISVTYHQGTFHEQTLNYKAEVRETFFSADSSISPAVSVIAISYIKENITTSTQRPVVFVFNGGPGASSSPLHMNAFGPMRIRQSKDSSMLVQNPYCLLDLADLVFIDPPGTGFTRVFDSKAASAYWDVKGDAQLFADLIIKWKKENNRESSPVFLCGESYGTARAAMIVGITSDLPVSGVIFLSSVFDMSIVTPAPANDMPYVLFLPSMAAVAWYHHKLDPKIKSAEQAYNKAILFALNEYISALAKGINLSAKEREQTAVTLSGLTGLPKQTLLEKDLRITPADFELLLLAKEQKRIGQLNGQITGPLYNPGVKPPFDDPSMSLRPSTRGIVGNYFTKNLQFPDTLSYKTLNLDVNSRWNWSSMEEEIGYSTVTPKLKKAAKDQPALKLFVAGGYYDLATPLYAARYILEHAGIPAERITYASFPTGHSIFENETELEKLTKQIRSFIINSVANF